jgi:hypothetical protein
VVAAIDEVVSSLNVVSRNLARARLLEASTPYAALNLEVSANEISVALDDHQVVSPRSGEAVRTSTPTGVRAAVRQQLFGRSLIQVLHTRSGTRQNRFQLSADGARLAVEVRIAAERCRTSSSTRSAIAAQTSAAPPGTRRRWRGSPHGRWGPRSGSPEPTRRAFEQRLLLPSARRVTRAGSC